MHPSHLLGQQNTMRDAVLAGLTLDTFHRHADKVAMANIAQLINCLQALFFAHEDKFAVTPTYHVFDLYLPHQGADSLRTLVSAPRSGYLRAGNPASIRGLSASASMKDKQLTLTVTNPDLKQSRETEIILRGATAKEIKVMMLGGGDAKAHNTFEDPRAVELKGGKAAQISEGKVLYAFAPASVTRLQITLA
jgi:alpha-N-arabinofuranosidase